MYQLKDSVLNPMLTPNVKMLRGIFKEYGYEIRIVGGAVRDVIIDKKPKDLDFATTATLQEMKEMFTKEGIRMVNSNGEKHGTITACINNQQTFEITTINLNTPGWPNEKDWENDARRRDLTINSMTLDFDGKIYDNLGGLDDLEKRKVRFSADADWIRTEDYFRTMRYFRFHSQLAENPAQHEERVLQAIKAAAPMLVNMSGELIWKELKIILQEKSRDVEIKTMMDVGIGRYIGLPWPNLAEFQNVCLKNKDTAIQPASLLAALCYRIKNAKRLHSRLKFSNDEMKLIEYILINRAQISSDDTLLPYLKLIYCERKLSRDTVEKYVMELLQYIGGGELLDESWALFKFPINEMMLKANGVSLSMNSKPKRKYKFVVEELLEYWHEHDYKLSADELLKLIPNILQEYRTN